MEKIIIQDGDNRLVGKVKIEEGAKSVVLPLLAATVLASEGQSVLKNVPVLSDVFTMNNVVRGLNTRTGCALPRSHTDSRLVETDRTLP